MNGKNLLVDTNVILYCAKWDTLAFDALNGNTIYTSNISRLELLGYYKLTPKEEEKINHLLDFFTIIPLDKPIEEQAIALRRTYKISIPDAIIAATAMQYQFPLLTADQAFTKVEEIEVVIYEVQ